MAKKQKKRMVLVTTNKDRRGVFFGQLESSDDDRVVLSDAQMAVYWSSKTRGVLGLASIGPQDGSRITPIVPRIELNGVTSVMDCTPEACEKWKQAQWK